MRRRLIAAAALLLAVPAAAQQAIVIYHCTDARGAVTVQNDTPCPAGTTQRTREIDPPPPLPAYVPMAPPPAPAPSLLAAPVAPLVPGSADSGDPAVAGALAIDLRSLPAPPLQHCVAYDQTRYYTPDTEPRSRCQPMRTVGIGGLQGLGAGAACIRVTDSCEPVPEAALCEAWQARLDEAEFRMEFAQGHYDTRARRDEYEAIARIIATSVCAAD
ncbi:DUF4124 domain-containing protein [Luteimonas sp. RD2P54]|uniref:DUF4124 domain-containing protein n=1 Tax=Luteimonas endophytica TaxID=3042023 RepID=A0ABT6J572_9GAMM|nr:DUF4124 domain-containing protein [Luteimonas endophytica]MDH5821946.1 DUF4124 domain-containing protein [Luteimonas endophytica]